MAVTGVDAVNHAGLEGLEVCAVVQDGVQKGRIVARRLLAMLEQTAAEREGRPVQRLGEPEELELPVRWGNTVAPVA